MPIVLRFLALLGALVLAGAPAGARNKLPPLRDPVFLNIGFVCKWQTRCIREQQRAHGRAIGYVRKYRPGSWKVQLCNRNASRRGRVDWIGFDNCIRNPRLRTRAVARRR